jgi:CRP-like cAMP-binding protein
MPRVRLSSPVRLEELLGQKLFTGVDVEAALYLFEGCRRRMLAQGETLISPGSREPLVYLILTGTLDVLLDQGAHAVATLNAGDCVGELSLLDGRPRSAGVVAKEPSVVLEVGRRPSGP